MLRNFPFWLDSALFSNNKDWSQNSYLCILLQHFVKSGLYFFTLTYTSLLADFSVVTKMEGMKYTFQPKRALAVLNLS